MRITCPSCGAAYQVPDALLATRRALRCAGCGQTWVPGGPSAATRAEPSAAPPPPAPPPAEDFAPVAARLAAPVIEPRAERAAAAPRRAGNERLSPLALAWAGSLAAFAALLAGLVLFRAEIAAAWPPFQRVALLFGG